MKGQYFSFDAIVAAVIFVLALVALLSYWHSVRSFLDYQNDPLSKESIRVSNLLFMPPAPSSACGSMQSLGIVLDWNDRRVDKEVLDCARLQGQDWLKDKLDTPYGVVIDVSSLATGHPDINIGGTVPSDSINVVKIRRLATVVNSTGATYLATVDLTMYR
ncbi:MAG: hypothetical protein AB1295_03110 [Candidatus Micrarchaeota archaeon]